MLSDLLWLAVFCLPASSGASDELVAVSTTAAHMPAASLTAPARLGAELAAQAASVPAERMGAAFDNARAGAASAPEAVAPAPPPQWTEPEFDPSWGKIANGIWSGKGALSALGALRRRFAADEDSSTGLSQDAPEALRMLTLAIKDRKIGAPAFTELDRELTLVSTLKPEQKRAFAAELESPWSAYVAIAESRAPHFADAQLYFARMERLLGEANISLSQFIEDEDRGRRFPMGFLLRAHAYDALLPYLNRHPSEAGKIAPLLLPAKNPAAIKPRAGQIEGFLTQLAASGGRSGALNAFIDAALLEISSASPGTARRIALLLALNKELLPADLRPEIDRVAATFLPDDLQAPEIASAEPYSLWPQKEWRFAIHFSHDPAYGGWRKYFLARGYRRQENSNVIFKDFGDVKIVIEPKLYQGDEEGFLRGEEAGLFLKTVAQDLRDPAVSGVILRMHAQFRIADLFRKGAADGKLLFDGSCRSAWDAQKQRRRCPTCSFVLNTGTGMSRLNNPALFAVLEGLGRRLSWGEIGAKWKRAKAAESSRLIGPWTPVYDEAIGVLEEYEKGAPFVGR